MATRFQATSLVASPSYPSAVAWSDENLIAVASGHLITILNPSHLFGPRGLITIPPSEPFPFGVIERKDLFSSCLLPTCLSRDLRPCVRSISWSPTGMAPNAGCLLSVCTTEGRVKLYRMPYCEFSAEWVEVCDISELMYSYFSSVNFLEDTHALVLNAEQDSQPASDLRKGPKRRRKNSLAVIDKDFRYGDEDPSLSSTSQQEKLITAAKEVELLSNSILQEGSSVEVLMLEGQRRIWIAGSLSRFDGKNAIVKFPEADNKGKRAEFPQINSEVVIYDYLRNRNNCAPKIRPSVKVGYLPKQISSPSVLGVDKILKTGDAIEAWTNDRWIEGTFMGSNESGLLVKFQGDIESVILDASSVRLLPLWINQEKSWKITLVMITMKDQDLCREDQIKPDNVQSIQYVPVSKSKTKTQNEMKKGSSLPLITADQYASRNALLSSLVVAWSPIVQLMPQIGTNSTNYSPNRCTVLAIGGKSGKISFWRINGLQYFSVLSNKDPTSAILVGILLAHSAWVTAISWSLSASDISDSRLLLATGSSDGSVKMWIAYSGELLKSSEVNFTPFSLFKEVIPTNFVPISVVTLRVSNKSPHKMHLAVGKGSGSFDVLICDLATLASSVNKIGSYEAHDHIVTGLVWAFDGSCLYSCSQDNSVHSWSLCENTLSEVPIPLNPHGVKNGTKNVPNIFDSCFGLAVSPGNMVIAVARSFDADSLNPMYQKRSQKAAVEFFWIGGQQRDTELEFEVQGLSGLSERERSYWVVNLLWSLNQYEDANKPLVVCDIIEAIATFKQCSAQYVEHILTKWLISFLGSGLDLPIAKTLSQAPDLLPKMSSRQLHILNIVIRHVFLTELNADEINLEQAALKGFDGSEDEHLPLWLNLLFNSEKELRERILAFSFSVILSLRSQPSQKTGSQYQRLVGIAQMEQWVALCDHTNDHLKLLSRDIKKLQRSKLQRICEYVPEEQCSFCSASVPFESAEVGFCRDGHKLLRCAASMKVCPITPSWFCVCCRRRVSNLPPGALFIMPAYPLGLSESFRLDLHSTPLCLFCGILLQRLQPDFLLSASPV